MRSWQRRRLRGRGVCLEASLYPPSSFPGSGQPLPVRPGTQAQNRPSHWPPGRNPGPPVMPSIHHSTRFTASRLNSAAYASSSLSMPSLPPRTLTKYPEERQHSTPRVRECDASAGSIARSAPPVAVALLSTGLRYRASEYRRLFTVHTRRAGNASSLDGMEHSGNNCTVTHWRPEIDVEFRFNIGTPTISALEFVQPKSRPDVAGLRRKNPD